MKFPSQLLVAVVVGACRAHGKSVFAHFMMGNVPEWSVTDFEADFQMAKEAGIDAFALKIASADSFISTQVGVAFEAADNVGFSLFFSFDYSAEGAWTADIVVDYINGYKSYPSYFLYNGQPFVSTFEGPKEYEDWIGIKSDTSCFFVPDWSSLGAEVAVGLGVADGLFSWAAWPYGPDDMYTAIDASYNTFLGQQDPPLPYMMPVSPWFYTNLPYFDKNWLWRGDDLWYNRWQQVLSLDPQPEWVEIITWNDYGESHYIGPLHPEQYPYVFGSDGGLEVAPFNYAADMPHDGWRQFLPYVIDTFKNGYAYVTQEGVVGWYRLQPSDTCPDGGTTGNTLSQDQCEYTVAEMVQDFVFFSALLGSYADITVTIGGTSTDAAWNYIPTDFIGIYHGSIPFDGNLGEVTITVSRDGATVASFTGEAITTTCSVGAAGDTENWNTWVGNATGDTIVPVTPSPLLADQNCTSGKGVGNYNDICELTCTYGYCPVVCTCDSMGVSSTEPAITGDPCYPLATEDSSYDGLCSWIGNHGFCDDFSAVCGSEDVGVTTPSTDPVFPVCYPATAPTGTQACINGTGIDNYEGLCSFGCSYGYCPADVCICLDTGDAVPYPLDDGTYACPALGLDSSYYGLCLFACSHGYCPPAACEIVSADTICDLSVFKEVYDVDYSNLNADSSCNDLGSDGNNVDAEWNDVNATDELAAYLDTYTAAGNSDFLYDFSLPLGVEASITACSSLCGNGCARPNCQAFTWPYTPGYAWKYLTLTSIANLNLVLCSLYNGIGTASSNFSQLLPEIQDTIFPPKQNNDLLWEYVLTGISAAISALSALTGNPEVGAAGALMAGAIAEGLVALSGSGTGDTEPTTEQLSIANSYWTSKFQNQLVTSWGNLQGLGTDMVDTFTDGAFVDYRGLPVLNSEIDGPSRRIQQWQANEWYFNILLAALTNYAWSKNYIYISCFPMDESTFTNTVVLAGNNDSRLKFYTPDGHGCYFQGIDPTSETAASFGGSTSLGNGTYNFTMQNVINGSYNSFTQYGFNYTADTTNTIANTLATSIEDLTSEVSIYTTPGLFNLPICDPSGTWTQDEFFANLNAPGDGYGYTASWCGCLTQKDVNGKTFGQFVPTSEFECSCNPSSCCTETGSIVTCPARRSRREEIMLNATSVDNAS